MFNLSNALSILRVPLALVFLIENPSYRIGAILLAMLTDGVDGYLARRLKITTRLGAALDPAMDKFFVIFCLGILFLENKLQIWQILTMLSRDFAVSFFGLYLWKANLCKSYQIVPPKWGKISTALQFIVLIGVTLGYQIPWYFFAAFVIFGLFSFLELFQFKGSTFHLPS